MKVSFFFFFLMLRLLFSDILSLWQLRVKVSSFFKNILLLNDQSLLL